VNSSTFLKSQASSFDNYHKGVLGKSGLEPLVTKSRAAPRLTSHLLLAILRPAIEGSAMATKCPKCKAENSDTSRFCADCGTRLDIPEKPPISVSETLSYSPDQKAAISESLKFSPGEKFGDRYTIIEEIGRGGMGRVYKAEDHELGITVVLKMIRPELSSRPRMIDHFRKETLLGRSISHENVVRIHDLGVVNNIRYISMDFIKGENLSELIQTSGSLTLATCLQIALQICQALKAAHEKGIIHQDLKPQNIMIDNSGKVYVTDFGLAESLSEPKAGLSGKICGTPKYFSPEQAKGEEADQRSGIYSLGGILYEMTTGKTPFKADTVEGYIRKHIFEKPPSPSKVNPSIPPACEKIILKCLEKKKEDRYQTVEELLQDLEIQKKQGHGAGPGPKINKWQRTLRAAALTLLLGVVIYGSYKLIIHPRPLPPSGRTSIAVMYAVNNTGDKSLDDQLRWEIPYYLGMDLAQSKYLSVLPQDRLMQVLSDMKQMDEERHLSRTLDQIADAANVQYFVLPSFTKVGDNFLISFMIRKAKSDAILGEPDSVKGKNLQEDLVNMVEGLSLKVKSRLSLSPTEIANDYNKKLNRITTSSLEAVRYYVEAEKYYVLGDFKASNQVLEKAVKEDPNYAIAFLKMADNYDYLREYDKHMIYLPKALTLVDRVSERDRYLIQGDASLAFKESPLQAIANFKKVIDLYPEDEEGLLSLGAIWRELEEWDLASRQVDKVLTINPKNSLALENKVYIDTCQGRYREAVELCEANAKTPFNGAFFLRQLLLLYLCQGLYDRASAEIEKALAYAPDDFYILEREGHLHYLRGDLASARQIYEQLQQRGEATPDAPNLRGRLWLAYLHLLQGEYRQAQEEILGGIELARKASRIYDELDYRLLLAYSELQHRQFSHAAEALKPALELAQKTVQTGTQKLALHLLGLASLGAGQIEDAERIGQQLFQLVEKTSCPKHLRHYDHLMGRIALAEGRPEQAIHDFEQAIALLPSQRGMDDEQAFYYDGLAAAYYQNGDWPKAIETYTGIIALTTGRLQWGDIYARSYYWLGKIHQRTGYSLEAVSYYERFLQLWKHADSGLPEVADAQKQLEALRKAP
jgi:serine/threonine protein kinase/tetratricopeptide (TPR) repeat protein